MGAEKYVHCALRERERELRIHLLLPVSLDSSITAKQVDSARAALERRNKNVACYGLEAGGRADTDVCTAAAVAPTLLTEVS